MEFLLDLLNGEAIIRQIFFKVIHLLVVLVTKGPQNVIHEDLIRDLILHILQACTNILQVIDVGVWIDRILEA